MPSSSPLGSVCGRSAFMPHTRVIGALEHSALLSNHFKWAQIHQRRGINVGAHHGVVRFACVPPGLLVEEIVIAARLCLIRIALTIRQPDAASQYVVDRFAAAVARSHAIPERFLLIL